MKKLLFNPFEKYDARPVLIMGLLATVAGSILAYLCNARYDGAFHITFAHSVNYAEPFSDNVFNIAVLFFTLYILGYIINRKTRPIDILATVMVARLPFYLDTLSNINGYMQAFSQKVMKAGPNFAIIDPSELLLPVLLALLTLPLLIWYIVLLYNGFAVAVNLKKTSHKVAFAGVLVVAEIVSRIFFYILHN